MLLINTMFSQNDYISYYQLIAKARKIDSEAKSDSVPILLKKAFSQVDYVHLDNLKFGKKMGKKYKSDWLKGFCKKGVDSHDEKIDKYLKAKVDSLFNEDQRVRSSKHSKSQNYYRKCLYDTTFVSDSVECQDAKLLMEEWWRVDSSNVEELKKIITLYGFPSEQVVGKDANENAAFILLQYDKDTANHEMGEVLEKALQVGAINPNDYAWIIDRHLMNAGKEQFYQFIPTPWICMIDEKRKYYNRNRASIGLKPLEDLKIKIRKNSVSVIY